MKKTIYTIVICTGLLVCCKKEQPALPAASNNALLYGTWYLKRLALNNIVSGVSTPINNIAITFKTDYYTFNTNNTVNVSYSGTAPTTYTVNYQFTNTANVKTLVVNNTAVTPVITYSVTKLTTDSLILFNTTSSTTAGITTIVNTTNYYTH